MAKKQWAGRLDPLLVKLVKEQARDLERSEAFILEMSLREMFKNKLPPGWKPGMEIES